MIKTHLTTAALSNHTHSQYLTTAALSDHTHSQYLTNQTAFVFSNSNGVTFGTNGSTVTASVNTNYQAPGAYLTTAALSNHSHNFATTTTNGAVIVVGTTNSNGATIGVPAFLTTAQPVGAYLTTARASNDAIGLNTALTGNGVSVTANSSGLSINVPAFLTTAAATNVTTNNMATSERGNYFYTSNNTFANSTHSHGAVAFSGTNVSASFTSASNGLSINLSAGAGGAGDGYNIIGVNGNTVGSANTVQFSNGNNVTFGLAGSTVTASASYPTQTAYVFSNSNGVSFGTNGSTVTATVKTDYLTTAMATGERGNYFYTSNNTFANNTHTHGNPTLALTNLSGTTASASNGLTISLSAAAPGGGGGAGTNTALNLTNLTGTLNVNTNGVSLSMSAAAPGGGAAPSVYWAIPPWGNNSHALLTNVTATAMTQRPFFMPVNVNGNLTAPEIVWPMSRATSGSNAFTVLFGMYKYNNSTQITLVNSTSAVYSNTATASVSGIKYFELDLGTGLSTLSGGNYFMGMAFSAAATASMNYSLMGVATGNQPNQSVVLQGTDTYATYTSHSPLPFWGRYSTTTNAMPNALTYGQVISATSSNFQMNFTIGQHV